MPRVRVAWVGRIAVAIPILLLAVSLLTPSGTRRLAVEMLLRPPLDRRALGDGGPATGLRLISPMALAGDRVGNVYVGDRGHGVRGRMIWRIDPAGTAWAVAGTGAIGEPVIGAPALASPLGSPEGIAVDRAGRVSFADSLSCRVLRVERDGTLTLVAGDGRHGYGGDGGPADEASLYGPYDLALADDGTLYVADAYNHRVRRVTPDGTIDTVAGDGRAGYSGDGGPATAARLDTPYGVAIDGRGRLLIADSRNHVVRRVEEDGTIVTIAGTGERGWSGDGGDARRARLDAPEALEVAADGRLFIGDEGSHTVRVLSAGGTIDTVAGTGAAGRAGPGLSPARMMLGDPESILLVGDDELLVSEGNNGRVVAVHRGRAFDVFAGRAD